MDTQVNTCVQLACIRWEFRNKFKILTRWKKLPCCILDVKKETYDDKYIDDEKEKN
jgi:hypothetical protein